MREKGKIQTITLEKGNYSPNSARGKGGVAVERGAAHSQGDDRRTTSMKQVRREAQGDDRP